MAEESIQSPSSVDSIYSATEASSEETESLDEMPRSRSHNHVNYKDVDDEEIAAPASNKSTIDKILAHKYDDDKLELYVKFNGKSYRECQWVPDDVLKASKISYHQLKRYLQKYEANPPKEPYFPAEYTIPKKIVACKKKESGTKYLVLWKGLEYMDMTWENKDSLPKELLKKFKVDNEMPPQEYFVPPHKPEPNQWKPITELQKSKSGKVTRSYQLEGLNFLTNSWYNNKNSILADEMGLGKTCQACVFIRYLFNEEKIKGPFLVLVPLSTITHWERELQDWTDCRILTYFGTKERREAIKNYETFYEGSKVPKFNVLLTTYDYAIKDAKVFGNLTWQCIIVDEAHRLKNFDSKLTKTMKEYNANYKMLLTGTPLQNNTQELWSLLNFLDDKNFDDLNDFQEKFGELTEKDQIIQLQSILKPLMLRRLKGDVEKGLAPLEEIIIECGMTPHQRIYYQSIYKQNFEYLTRGKHRMAITNFNNIQMQLRKVCNHPYLIPGAEDQIIIERKEMATDAKDEREFEMECLIKSSGKMILLDKLLSKLKDEGHRVLIFSQMTKMLTIIEDFLIFRGYKYERLDGNVRGNERQQSIDRYNAKDSEDFVFLLCTKAGGVGINLTTADTVIIYDSDWNPQNDLQATARCHRIGQTKSVKAYRFLTAKTYERKMFDTASVKLGLDHAVLESGKVNFSNDEMEKMLRLGAYYAFEDDGDTEQINEGDIETILSRSTTIKHENLVSGDGSTFSKVAFQVQDEELDVTDPEFWKKYMPIVEEEEQVAGGTIAERRRLQRDMSNSPATSKSSSIDLDQFDNDEDLNFKTTMSKLQIVAIHRSLLRFGWARWRAIVDTVTEAGYPTDVNEVKTVCHCCLSVYIKAMEEKDPILLSIYQQGTNKETADYEKKLVRNHRDTFSEFCNNVSQKVNRITFMMFVNNIVGKCPNPPEGLDFPKPRGNKPAEWWTINDDKLLLYATYKNGYGHYNLGDVQYSQPLDDVPKQLITNRLKNIVNIIKEMVVKLRNSGNSEVTLDKSLLQQLRAVWNKKEHRHVINSICNFGYPEDKDSFVKFCDLDSKEPEQVIEYADMIVGFVEEYDPENVKFPPKMVEPIPPGVVKRIKFRMELFKKAREFHEKDKCINKVDKQIIKLFVEKGYPGSEVDPEFQKLMVKTEGNQIINESNITRRIQSITKVGEYRQTLHSFVVPKYEVDENGKAILPCFCTPSLQLISMGKVVTDRDAFHSERYLYPDGFMTERLYQSCVDLSKRDWYVNTILDTGEDYPIFKVYVKDHPEVKFEATAASKCWQMVIIAIEDLKKKNGINGNRTTAISGPDYFGLTNPLVAHLMRDLEGADKCFKYNPPQEVEGAKPQPRRRTKFSDSSDNAGAEGASDANMSESDSESGSDNSIGARNRSESESEEEKLKERKRERTRLAASEAKRDSTSQTLLTASHRESTSQGRKEGRKESQVSQTRKEVRKEIPPPKRQIKKLELRIDFRKLVGTEFEPRASIGSHFLLQQKALSVPMIEHSEPETAVREAVEYLANEYK